MKAFTIHNIYEADEIFTKMVRCRKSEQQVAIFRGHANASWNIEPFVFRDNRVHYEASIFKRCQEQYPLEFSGCKNTFEVLTKMQHYGAATRLLDFTIDPYVSLYFACKSHSEEDAAITGMVMQFTDINSVQVQSICYYAQYDFSLNSNRNDFYDRLRFHLNRTFPDEYLERMLSDVYCIIPPITSERLRRQKGCFLLFGEDIEQLKKNQMEKSANSILDDGRYCGFHFASSVWRFDIPSTCKSALLRELKERNYTDDDLIPNIERSFKAISNSCLK